MTEYQDYKYVMQDTASLYLGAKYTYEELVENDDVPFKLKTIIERYIRPETDMDTSLESHFYYMDSHGFVYQAYKQLKIKIKASVLEEKKSVSGKSRPGYVTKNYKLEAFVLLSPAEKEKLGMVIQEIGMSKMSLLTFSV